MRNFSQRDLRKPPRGNVKGRSRIRNYRRRAGRYDLLDIPISIRRPALHSHKKRTMPNPARVILHAHDLNVSADTAHARNVSENLSNIHIESLALLNIFNVLPKIVT
jgi:hypothetical protein